ncbi:MAG: hypothetical protein Q8942_09630 [Bacillota bacterium]|nr:hypothetical protein [Bacillota bacterium]
MALFSKRNVVSVIIILFVFISCFTGVKINSQKRTFNKIQEDCNYTYVQCLEQIAYRIEDYKNSKDSVTMRNAASWAGKATIASKNMNYERKQDLSYIATMLDEFFANSIRPESAIKTGSIYRLIPYLKAVAKYPNDKQKIDDLTQILPSID